MEVLHTHCAGLDVHKKTVVACVFTPGPTGKPQKQSRTFSTMTRDLLALSDWLTSLEVRHVAMESTGEFWKPVFNILEATVIVLVVNAHHIKNVPGRKTDVKDAEWIADLLRHGLLRGSFIPPLPQPDLRDLTRHRTNLVQDRAAVINRLQKVLEWANLKLSSVATDVTGVSARAMLAAIIDGEGDPSVLADLAQGRMRSKLQALEQALTGRVRDHHRFLLAQHLLQLDGLEEQSATFEHQIATIIAVSQVPEEMPSPSASHDALVPDQLVPASTQEQPLPPLGWEAAVTLLDTIPGVGRTTAELIVAEIGTDMQRFGSAAQLASWAKLCPGNHESAGKRYSGKTGTGNRWLRGGLVQAAHAAVKVKESHLAAVYHRLVGRRGVKKAIIAVAHRLITAAYSMVLHHDPYREPGAQPIDEQRKTRVLNHMLKRLEKLGYHAHLEPIGVPMSS